MKDGWKCRCAVQDGNRQMAVSAWECPSSPAQEWYPGLCPPCPPSSLSSVRPSLEPAPFASAIPQSLSSAQPSGNRDMRANSCSRGQGG